MTEPFSDEYVAATFGRDIPWPEACPSQARDILNHFPETYVDWSKFSNANAAIRKSYWEIIPFDEKIPAAEDVLWARQIVSLGYKIEYVPEAKVFHSHSASLRYINKRAYIESKSLNALDNRKHNFSFFKAIRFFCNHVKKDILFTIKKGYSFFWLFHIPLYRAFQSLGLYKGFRDGFSYQINQVAPFSTVKHPDFKEGDSRKKNLTKTKKILFVVHCFLPESVGGTEYYTFNLAKGFLKRGWDVTILSALRESRLGRYMVIKTKYEGINVIKINNPHQPNARFLDHFIDFNIDKIFSDILKSEMPDIVHFQHIAYLSSRMPEICYQHGIPSLFTLHDYWYICYRSQLIRPNEGVCPGPLEGLYCSTCYDSVNSEPQLLPRFPTIIKILQLPIIRYSGIKEIIPSNLKTKIKNFLYKPISKNDQQNYIFPDMWATLEHSFRMNFMKRQLSFAENIISPSKHLKKRYENEGYGKIIYIPHGFEQQKKVAKMPFDGQLIFAYLSNIVPFKGAHVILREIGYVQERQKVRLLIYGKVLDENYFNELKNLARKYPETDIFFAGQYKGLKELSKILEKVHAVIFPSIWEENHPLIVKESYLFGIPVICSSLGGAKESVEDGVNGLIFNPFKEGDLAEKINSLINNSDLLEKITEGARNTKIEGMEEHLQKIEDIYFSIIKK